MAAIYTNSELAFFSAMQARNKMIENDINIIEQKIDSILSVRTPSLSQCDIIISRSFNDGYSSDSSDIEIIEQNFDEAQQDLQKEKEIIVDMRRMLSELNTRVCKKK